MGSISYLELRKIVYLDPQAVDGRSILIMPFWDGSEWHLWTEAPPGSIIKLQIVDAVHSNYIAKEPVTKSDIYIEFIDLMWQRATWPEINKLMLGIQDDFHLLATSLCKLRHFFDKKDVIDSSIISSFVKSELEYIVTVSRSVFDLIQEVIAFLWNNCITLSDLERDAIRRRHKLPDKFTKTAIRERGEAKSVEELTDKYAIPISLAEEYHRLSPFYVSLLRIRDKIIHGGGSVETVFATEKGFCVDPKAPAFSEFLWTDEHRYNENLVSLIPWIANIIFGTIDACNRIVGSFASMIAMPREMAPGYRVFIRDPANVGLLQLADVINKKRFWWSDMTTVA
ncbi:hypothetical protein [Xanthobacter aminoxidans]|uniref:Apea-like HEPN domain-containing protein n=1 Tax=Xanthobacter aminoxidans TaxID=186280 RepID=A0ABW6ZLR6_9HYPH